MIKRQSGCRNPQTVDTAIRMYTVLLAEKKRERLEPGTPVIRKAILAIYRSALSWLEGYFAIFSAV
jgi:hypothetical protein